MAVDLQTRTQAGEVEMRIKQAIYCGILVAAFDILSISSQAQSTLHFRDGNVVLVDIERVDARAGSVFWRTYPGGKTVRDVSLSRLSWIEFEETSNWRAAEDEFQKGEFKKALELFTEIANARSRNHYPIPGNFSSIALKRSMSCYQRLLDTKQVSVVGRQVQNEKQSLPPHLREFSLVERAWITAGYGDWRKLVNLVENNEAPQNSEVIELSFLAGVANKALGNRDKAIDGFTEAYALGFGSYPRIAERSLRSSAELVFASGDTERTSELSSQLQIYKDLYGNGDLWDDVSPDLVSAASTGIPKLDFFGSGGGAPSQAGSSIAGKGSGKNDKTKDRFENAGLSVVPASIGSQKDRDYLLAIESYKRTSVNGVGEFQESQSNSPRSLNQGLYYDGSTGLERAGVQINKPAFNLKLIFVPEDGIGTIFSAGADGLGVSVYLKSSDLYLTWNTKKGEKSDFKLGRLQLGRETTLFIENDGKGSLVYKIDKMDVKNLGRVSTVAINNPVTARLAGATNEVIGDSFGGFKGLMRFISVGFGDNVKNLTNIEKSSFNGKSIVFDPPN